MLLFLFFYAVTAFSLFNYVTFYNFNVILLFLKLLNIYADTAGTAFTK